MAALAEQARRQLPLRGPAAAKLKELELWESLNPAGVFLLVCLFDLGALDV